MVFPRWQIVSKQRTKTWMVGSGDGAGQIPVPGSPTALAYSRTRACCACSCFCVFFISSILSFLF